MKFVLCFIFFFLLSCKADSSANDEMRPTSIQEIHTGLETPQQTAVTTMPVKKSNTSFTICNVEPAKEILPEKKSGKTLREVMKCDLESWSDRDLSLIPFRNNGFVDAVNYAFMDHRPLVISPDMIWLLICQGFAIHINENSESLRSLFVNHEGKEEILIEEPNFKKGNPNNNWQKTFSSFSQELRNRVKGDICDRLIQIPVIILGLGCENGYRQHQNK